jgi:hypothetical protein
LKTPHVPPPDPLSDLDLECLQTGRAMMLVAYRSIMRKLGAQSDILEAQLRASTLNGTESASVRQAVSGIRPAMARTLALVGESGEQPPVKKRRGRPPGRSKGIKNYWANMKPGERAQEIQRRFLVRHGKLARKPRKSQAKPVKPGHPRNSDHPDHAKWVAKMRRSNQASWNKLTPQEKQRRVDAMLAVRGKQTKMK